MQSKTLADLTTRRSGFNSLVCCHRRTNRLEVKKWCTGSLPKMVSNKADPPYIFRFHVAFSRCSSLRPVECVVAFGTLAKESPKLIFGRAGGRGPGNLHEKFILGGGGGDLKVRLGNRKKTRENPPPKQIGLDVCQSSPLKSRGAALNPQLRAAGICLFRNLRFQNLSG